MKEYVFIFDIGNVMIDFDLPVLQKRIAAASTITLSQLQCDWMSEDFIRVETGKIDPENYFEKFSRGIGLSWSYDEWIDQWASIYTLNREGRRLFVDLHNQGHQIAILSNLASYNVTAIERKFPDFFTVTPHNFFSFNLGFHKPDSNIYHAACRSLQAQPSQCTFLDDSLGNVEGAKAIGMHALQFSSAESENVRQCLQQYL